MTTTQEAITTSDLDAGYSGAPVVRGLNLSVKRGEILSVLGPNGAGKTTTLLTLAGVIPPVAGSVSFAGLSPQAPLHVRARRGLRLLTEQRAIAGGLTTLENLRLGGADPKKALEIFPELEQRLRTRVANLSGGEQQMAALGRSLSCDASVLLADELSLGLAPLVVDRLLLALRQAADNGLAVVLVEQIVAKALEVADNVVVMVRGRVTLADTSDSLRKNPSQVSEYYFESPS